MSPMQIRELLDELLTSLETGPLISAVRHFEAKPAVFASFPSSLDPRIVEALKDRGVEQLYSHQASAFETAAKGEHLVVVTPTASGKTLCYNLPVLQALVQQPEARVLYLFPTKALAQDQLAELTELAKSLPDMRMFTYDGDTPQDARRSVRARANLVLTNPDMLHSGVLPHPPHGGSHPHARHPRPDHSRHPALGHPAAPHEVGEPLPEPPLRRDRRAARVSGGLRQPS